MIPRGRFRFRPPRVRLFDRGALRFLILDLLKEQPRHGYELILALRERFGGSYTPSPGAIYPALRWLEQRGYVHATREVGRTVYSILEEGRKLLAEQEQAVASAWSRASVRGGPHPQAELRLVRQELLGLAQAVRALRPGHVLDREKARRIREVIARAVREIEAILAEERPKPGSASG